MEQEEWKQIIIDNKTFMAEVSNMGNVRNSRNKKPCTQYVCKRTGSILFRFFDECSMHSVQSAHNLVAKMFIDNPKSYRTVKHINGDKHDNRVCNLIWVSRTKKQFSGISIDIDKLVDKWHLEKAGWHDVLFEHVDTIMYLLSQDYPSQKILHDIGFDNSMSNGAMIYQIRNFMVENI